MALAETAQLIVDLKLRDNLTAPLGRVQGAVGRTQSGMGRLQTASGRVTGAFGRMGGAIRPLLGPLGFIGLAGAIAATVGVMKTSVSKSQEFIATSQALAKVTGQSISNTSQLVDVLDKYGVKGGDAIRTFGLLERNVQTLAGTTKKAAAFQKEYGFSLTDSNGRIADANELLRRSRDYFNGSATASQKATVLARLYGRSWQQLIPLLSLSREQLEHQFDTALKLTPIQIRNLVALRNSQRELNDTIGDTQVLIGLALTPALTKAARALNSFITQNQAGIVALFEKGAAFAGELAGAINQWVVPALSNIAKAWNSIPADFRNLLIAGFVGNKILKMTIGFDPLDILRKQVTGLLSRGGNALTPLYVKEVGLAGLRGGLTPTATAGGIGIAGLGAIALSVIGSVAVAAGVIALVNEVSGISQEEIDIQNRRGQFGPRSARNVQAAAANAVKSQKEAAAAAALAVVGVLPTSATQRQKEARNDRTILTPERLKQALGEQNRANPMRRDLNDTGFRIVTAVRAIQSGIVAAVQGGNAQIVSAVWAVEAAVRGTPWAFGTASAQGRGTGPGGRPAVTMEPRVGIEQNRPIVAQVNVSARDVTNGQKKYQRYTPVRDQ